MLAELDAWDEPWLRRAHAALHRFHPDQEAFVFNNLKATRKADHAALETLAKRGIDDAERARLRSLIGRAESAPGVPASEVEAQKMSAERTAALMKLRAWYVDWAETAKAVIRRRKDLMLLGLAQKQSRGGDAATPQPSPTPPITSSPSVTTNGGGA